MTELKPVPKSPLFESNPQSPQDHNALIGTNALDTFENVDAVMAFVSDVNLLVKPFEDVPFTDRGSFGFYICIEAARAALRTQLEIIQDHDQGGQSPTD